MRTPRVVLCLAFIAAAAFPLSAEEAAKPSEWSMNATIIEACSCPMFCQCYFNTEPAGHASMQDHGTMQGHGTAGSKHYCKFNNAFRVNKGMFGETSLDGAKFWVSGDLGGDFSKGQMDWAVLTFDTAVTPSQRDGIMTVLGKLYPVKWNAFKVAKDEPMDWSATDDMATARLRGGKAGEVVLQRSSAGMGGQSPVIKNLQYWGATHNDGFVLMPNKVEAYHLGSKPFEYKGTNGFMITFDIASKDFVTKTAMK